MVTKFTSYYIGRPDRVIGIMASQFTVILSCAEWDSDGNTKGSKSIKTSGGP